MKQPASTNSDYRLSVEALALVSADPFLIDNGHIAGTPSACFCFMKESIYLCETKRLAKKETEGWVGVG